MIVLLDATTWPEAFMFVGMAWAFESTAAGIYCKQARHRCAAKSENGAVCVHWVPDERTKPQ